MEYDIKDRNLFRRVVLLASVTAVAACGLVYELSAGAVSSYLLGDAVTQFSLVIGVFLCAMGAGSWLSRFVTSRLLERFVELEIIVGLLGGASSIVVFAASAYASPLFPVIFFSMCASIGILIGMEIPLLIRILTPYSTVSNVVSSVLALDYAGALAGSILFPLLALPMLGISKASVVFGLVNLAVAASGLLILNTKRIWPWVKLGVSTVILMLLLFYSCSLTTFFEDMLYQDNIVYARSTSYQRIVITRWRNDIRLYLNGNIQFSSVDEARYHESLVIPAMEACPRPSDILVLGGGDGLAVREVLKYPDTRSIVLVDLDPEMTRLGMERPELVSINNGSLLDERVRIHNMDAMKWLEESSLFFDVIIIDLPDPNSNVMSKLYSTSFYALCARHLRKDGIMVTQATSPFFACRAFWCIVETVKKALPASYPSGRFRVLPYHVNVPSFGDWGFVMASWRRIEPDKLKISVPTRFLDSSMLCSLFRFGRDIRFTGSLEVNRLDSPVLYVYYKEGWRRFNQ